MCIVHNNNSYSGTAGACVCASTYSGYVKYSTAGVLSGCAKISNGQCVGTGYIYNSALTVSPCSCAAGYSGCITFGGNVLGIQKHYMLNFY